MKYQKYTRHDTVGLFYTEHMRADAFYTHLQSFNRGMYSNVSQRAEIVTRKKLSRLSAFSFVHKGFQEKTQARFQFETRDNLVNEPVFQQKLRRLKALRQFLLRRIFNDARSGKSDQRTRLRNNQVAERRKTRHDTRHGRVR